MKIIKPSYEIITPINGKEILQTIEKVARTCYKSEEKITEDGESANRLIKEVLLNRNHEAMIEFYDVIVKFICDRGVTHEVVRHRLASYAQESTRFCNYSKDKFDNGITYIDIDNILKLEIGKTLTHPITKETKLITEKDVLYWFEEWNNAMNDAEKHYLNLTNSWCPAQLARSVLPNSLKTEINVKFNLREWRHFFKLRCAKAAHPQMREITIPLLEEFKTKIPIIFDSITY
jgi:thymidylate synthase (FAD)